MPWNTTAIGKLESVTPVIQAYFVATCTGKHPTLLPEELILCTAVWNLLTAVLAAQPAGSIVEVRTFGDLAGGTGKPATPYQYTVSFSVTPVANFLA
jgi:hypothetical protein